MQHQQASKWPGPPQELVILIIQKLVTSAGNKFSAAADMRLVCKAWRAASSQYPAVMACDDFEDLSELCLAFPQLSVIIVEASESQAVGLSAAACI